MVRRDRQVLPVNRKRLALLLLPMLLPVGCGSAASGDLDPAAASSDYKKQALCDRFRGFMVGELDVIAPELENVPSDESIGWSASCTLRRSDSLIMGSLQVHNPRVIGEVEQPANFHPVEGHGEKVWMADDDPHWTELRTQVGPWVTKIRFYKGSAQTSTGTLAFGAAEIAETAEFLTRITLDIQA